MTDAIGFYSRDEKYGWLSNFHRYLQCVDGELYPTNEHYYQSQKAISPEFRKWIALAPNPYMAMKVGRLLRSGKAGELRSNWEYIKTDVMLNGLRAKFTNIELRKKLLDTGDAHLFEDSPTDAYWGGSLPRSENKLGKLLMQVREEFKKDTLEKVLGVI